MAKEPTDPEETALAEKDTENLGSSRRRDRIAIVRERIHKILQEDVATVALAQHAFKDEEEMDAAWLTTRQRRIAREWEKPKKEVAMALQASADRVVAMLRQEQEKPKVQMNIERAVIKLPSNDEQEDEFGPGIVIDVEASTK